VMAFCKTQPIKMDYYFQINHLLISLAISTSNRISINGKKALTDKALN
jgi:hypothetical protein